MTVVKLPALPVLAGALLCFLVSGEGFLYKRGMGTRTVLGLKTPRFEGSLRIAGPYRLGPRLCASGSMALSVCR